MFGRTHRPEKLTFDEALRQVKEEMKQQKKELKRNMRSSKKSSSLSKRRERKSGSSGKSESRKSEDSGKFEEVQTISKISEDIEGSYENDFEEEVQDDSEIHTESISSNIHTSSSKS